MERQEIINKANEAMAEEFEIEVTDITPDAIIKDTLDIDSLGLVDLVALIEGLFGVKILSTEIATIQNFQDLYDYIEGKILRTLKLLKILIINCYAPARNHPHRRPLLRYRCPQYRMARQLSQIL